MTLSRRELFGLFRRRPDTDASPPPAPGIPPAIVPQIASSACLARTGCAVCVERCPRPGAIVLARGLPQIVADACDGCGRCLALCPAPVLAIALVPRAAGREPAAPSC